MNPSIQGNPWVDQGNPSKRKVPIPLKATTEKATTAEEEEEEEDTNDPQLASRTLHPQMGGE